MQSEDVDDDFKVIIIPLKESWMYTEEYSNDIGFEGWYKVDPTTLCQYTGLTDKNGKRIWENDIVECNKRKEECELYKIVWRNEYADFGVVPISNTCTGQYPIGFSYGKTLHGRDYKSVGNIFDNPELLEVE